MTSDILDHLDRLIAPCCRLTFDELGDYVFGGHLRPDDDDHLADVARAGGELLRHEGLPLAAPVPPGVGFFLVAWSAEWIAQQRIEAGEAGMDRVDRRLRVLERKYGADDGVFPAGFLDDPPADWRAADAEWRRIADELLADTLRRTDAGAGAAAADLFESEPDAFNRRREAGRLRFAALVGRHDLVRRAEAHRQAPARTG